MAVFLTSYLGALLSTTTSYSSIADVLDAGTSMITWILTAMTSFIGWIANNPLVLIMFFASIAGLGINFLLRIWHAF